MRVRASPCESVRSRVKESVGDTPINKKKSNTPLEALTALVDLTRFVRRGKRFDP